MIVKTRILLLSLVLVTVAVLQANASTIDIVVTDAGYQQYQQTTNTPCIFGQSIGTCNGFGNQQGGTTQDLATLTADYEVSDLITLLGGTNQFILGYDINEGKTTQVLGNFTISVINGDTLYALNPKPKEVPALANGTGYADYVLTAPDGVAFSLAGLDPNEMIRFTYTMDRVNDGGEQVWLIAKGDLPNPVPEPASLLLFGTSLLGIIPLARLRKK